MYWAAGQLISGAQQKLIMTDYIYIYIYVQAIEKADSFIPSEMKDFLSVEGIFDGFIDIVVGEPIVLSESQLHLFPQIRGFFDQRYIKSFISYYVSPTHFLN